MKALVYTCVLALLFLGSCSKNDSVVLTPEGTFVSSKVPKVIPASGVEVERGVITPNTAFPFMTKYDLAEKQSKKINTKGSGRLAALYGPFTVPGNIRVIYPDRKTLLTTNQSLYSVGIYTCDIYICEYKFTLPAGAAFSLDNASKFGYENFSEQILGVTYSQVLRPTGKEYTIFTYSIIPKTNVEGRYIYIGTIPQDLTGTTFTYSYQL